MPKIGTHPSAQALAHFAHGKLSEDQAATVAAHLKHCADCRQAVAGVPPDSFPCKVRAARPSGTQLPPGPGRHRPPRWRTCRRSWPTTRGSASWRAGPRRHGRRLPRRTPRHGDAASP